MTSRFRVALKIAALGLVLTPAAVQAQLYREEIDGILVIQAVGTLPAPEDDDDPDIRTDASIRANCFEDFPDGLRFGTTNFEVVVGGGEVWGTGNNDVDRVEIGGRSSADFGFLPAESYDDGDCSDVEDQWDEYDKPDDGQFFFFGDLRVEPGSAGTDVRIDDGFRLTFFPGTTLTIRGTEEEPVEFRGGQWSGIDLNGAQADLEHCEIRQTSGGNGLRLRGAASAVVRDCLFENNEGRSGGAIQMRDNASLDLRDSEFSNNDAAFGGALHAEGGGIDIYMENVRFAGNEAQSRGGTLFIDGASADLANISVLNGEAGRGGGIYLSNNAGLGAVRMWNPVIAGNTGRNSGGGLRLSNQANVTLYNPTIAYNRSTRGGGIHAGELPSQLDIRNAIFEGNEIRDADDASGPQIQNDTPGNVELRRVMMEGGLGGYGGQLPTVDDVITGDVAFRDPPDDAGEGEGADFSDFRLASESDAINRGDGGLFDAGAFADLDRDGEVRIFGQQDPEIDLGAYEFPNNPPELLSTEEIELRIDEDDAPVSLQICSDFRDDDVPPEGFDARVVPWLTQAPGDGEELPETDTDDPQGEDFGSILQDEFGRPGDTISADSEIEDAGGRVFFDPANRSASYQVTVRCRVRNEVIDLAEDAVDEVRSILSRDAQVVRIQVDARNNPPSLDGVADEEATVGRLLEAEYRISDDDADHRPQDVEFNLVEGPDWVEVTRIANDEILLEGRPPQPGEFEVEIEVIDPGGGTAVERFTIEVAEAEPLDEVDAGDDRSAEPGERIRLSAEGPDEPTLTFEWRILDSDDNEVAHQPGADFTWTAPQAGRYTALVELIDAGDVIADDSLSIAVAAGLSGGVDDEPRNPPDAEQEAQVDGMSEDGDPENVADWQARDDNDKAAVLADTSGTELDDDQAGAVADQVDALLQQAEDDPAPLDQGLADDLARAQANLSGLELDDARRAQVAAGMERLRAQAREDGVASPALQDSLMRGASGLLADDDVPPEQRNRILAGLDDDLRAAEAAGRTLDDATTNRALAALQNSVGPGEVDEGQIDQILDGVDRAIGRNAAPSDIQLTMGVRVVGAMLSDREGAGLTSAQRARVKGVGDQLARAAIREGEPISVTGNRFLTVSARPIAPDVDEPILVGNPAARGPNALFTVTTQNELRARNGLDDEALGVALVATRRGENASYVVEVSATDSGGEDLSDTRVQAPVRVRIPIVGAARNEPRNVEGAPVTMSNVDTRDDGVGFDASGTGRFTLVSSVDPDDERSDSDKASCFLDSLF